MKNNGLALPEDGRVVIAHAGIEAQAIETAERLGLDYMLSELAPHGTLYVLDLDHTSSDAPWA